VAFLQERSDAVLDILGFSSYPEPMVAENLDLSAEEYLSDPTFDCLKSSLAAARRSWGGTGGRRRAASGGSGASRCWRWSMPPLFQLLR